MTTERWVGAAVLLLAAFAVVSRITLAQLRRWAYRDEAPVIPPLSREHYRFVGADESLQAKAAARREIAAAMKKRSALVASGSTSASVLKIARRA